MDRQKVRAAGLVLVVLLAGTLAAVSLPGIVAAAGDTDLVIQPSSQTVMEGENVTYDIVVSNADNGVTLYDINVSVDNTTAAEITGISNNIADATTVGGVASDNSSATMAAVGGDSPDTGSVTIATVTVRGNNAGVANLSVSQSGVGDEASPSNEYTITNTVPATVNVQAEPEAPDVTGNGQQARDLNNDGVFEDIDGDGNFTIFDVQTFLDNIDSDAVTNNSDLFDFDGQDRQPIFDVQALLDAYVASSSD